MNAISAAVMFQSSVGGKKKKTLPSIQDMMEMIRKGTPAQEALEKATGNYGRFAEAARYVDPRKE